MRGLINEALWMVRQALKFVVDMWRLAALRLPARRLGLSRTTRLLSTAKAIDPWSDPSVYSHTRAPIDEASTLPGSVYHSDSFFSAERERIFQSSWVAAAELCDLPNSGDVMPVSVGNTSIILTNDKGTIRAFHNVCRHRGAKLVSEKCSKRRTILCPYHRWGYALDGRLLATPSFDDDPCGKKVPERLRAQFSTHHVKNFDKEKNSLFPVRVDFALGLAFVKTHGPHGHGRINTCASTARRRRSIKMAGRSAAGTLRL